MKTTTTQAFLEKPDGFIVQKEIAGCYTECGDKILYLKANQSKGGYWGAPAGKIEKGESPPQAICRELFEETAIQITCADIEYMGGLYVRGPSYNYLYHMFRTRFSAFPSVSLSVEHQDYRWVTPEEAQALPLIPAADESLFHYCRFIRRES